MTRTFLNDSLLSNDVYKSNNTSGGNIEGFIRVKVEEYKSPTTVQTGSNFAAQMYQRPDGNYTISYRGTVSHTQPGDIAQNREAILKGQWTPEMQQAVQFTLLAIQQVAREKGISPRSRTSVHRHRPQSRRFRGRGDVQAVRPAGQQHRRPGRCAADRERGLSQGRRLGPIAGTRRQPEWPDARVLGASIHRYCGRA
jgi:hypothetical protein